MSDLVEHAPWMPPGFDRATPRLPWRLYSVEALAGAGTNLLISAIYFYTADRFHWTLKQNFMLATGLGICYVAGALTANNLTHRFERHRALAIVYAVMALVPMLAFYAGRQPVIVTALLLVYSYASTVGWPIIESLVSSDVDSHALSRRISIYNLVWSAVSVLMLAIDGTLIVHWPAGVFLIPVFVHGLSAIIMIYTAARISARRVRLGAPGSARDGDDGSTSANRADGNERETTHNAEATSAEDPETLIVARAPRPCFVNEKHKRGRPRHENFSSSKADPTNAPTQPTALPEAPEPEPELLRVRTLALWLSRAALPATYVVIFSLMALMPSLPVMQHIHEESRTLVGSIWMATRWLAFLVLGMGTWWHTRPRLLLLAAVVMLFAFFGVTLRPSDFLAHVGPHADLIAMIVAQLALGAALGMIYGASLYFGMVLSEGSTEHGGYHEALIGAGFIFGPGIGALAQTLFPGKQVYAGIGAVGGLVVLSVAVVAIISVRFGEKRTATA